MCSMNHAKNVSGCEIQFRRAWLARLRFSVKYGPQEYGRGQEPPLPPSPWPVKNRMFLEIISIFLVFLGKIQWNSVIANSVTDKCSVITNKFITQIGYFDIQINWVITIAHGVKCHDWITSKTQIHKHQRYNFLIFSSKQIVIVTSITNQHLIILPAWYLKKKIISFLEIIKSNFATWHQIWCV